MSNRTDRIEGVERALAHHESTGMIHSWSPPEPPHHDPNRRSKWRINLDSTTSIDVDLTGAHNLCLAFRRAEMAYGNVRPPNGGEVRITLPTSEARELLHLLANEESRLLLRRTMASESAAHRVGDLRSSLLAGIPIAQREGVQS